MTTPRRTTTRSEGEEPTEHRTLEDIAAAIRLAKKWGGPTLIAAIGAAVYTAWQLPRRMERVEEDHRQLRAMQNYIVCIARARRYALNPARCDRLDPASQEVPEWSEPTDSVPPTHE